MQDPIRWRSMIGSSVLSATLVALAALAGGAATAQEAYPVRPITLVTPYAVGGGSDILTRILADALSRNLGQPVVVKNVGGAGGVIGTQQVAQAAPDGYTLLHHHIGMATTPSLYKNLPFDVVRDFEPIGLFAETPLAVVAGKHTPPRNVAEFVDHVRKHGKQVTFASSGSGSATHLCAMQVEKATGTAVTMIQYKGAAPAMIDLQGGRVDFLCVDTGSGIIPPVKSGDLKAFVVTSEKRIDSLPDVPTTAEAGLKDLSVVTAWYGLYAPAKTPKPIIDRIAVALQAAVRDPAVVERLAKFETTAFDAKRATPEGLRERLASQLAIWTPLLKDAVLTGP
ncbi:MAG: Bug family tripartite tricarboxylate transporter substrate binding protein [Lautropia sp.]